MKKETILCEIVIELSYFLYLLRRIREVPYNEIGSRLRNVVSPEVANFIGSGVNLLRQGGKFSDYRVLFESKLLGHSRNPDIRVDELKALHCSISILEKCIRRDWDEFIEFTLLLLKNESNPFMTDEEIQQVLSEGAKGRAATHEEMLLMSETLIAERAKNPSVTLEQVMKQLGLEDIGTYTDFDFDDQTS